MATGPRTRGPPKLWTRWSAFAGRPAFGASCCAAIRTLRRRHPDRWDQAGDIHFVFGIDAMPNLKALADDLPAEQYGFLERPLRHAIKTAPRPET